MKLHGKKIEGLNVEEIFIPRGEETLVFKAQAIADYDEFEGMCPRPKPKKARNRQNIVVDRLDDPNYIQAVDKYAEMKVAYMVIKSLEATETLEWETVELGLPETWLNYKTELAASGFTDPEIARIFNGVMAACGLDQSKVDAARDRFLAGRQEESESLLSRRGEQNSTQSGELVNDSE